MKKKASLSLKLIAGFLAVALIAAGIGVIGWISNNQMSDRISDLGDKAMPSVYNLEEISLSLMKIRIALRSLMAPWLEPADIQRQFDNIEAARVTYQTALSNYNLLGRTEEEERLYQVFLEKLALSKVDNNALIDLSRKRLEPGADQNAIAYDVFYDNFYGNVRQSYYDMLAASDAMLAYATEYYGKIMVEEAKIQAQRMNTIMIAASASGLIVALIIGIFMSRSISESINRTTTDLVSSSQSLEGAAAQVSSSGQELSSSASELASSVEEMTSSLEELQSIIETNTHNIGEGKNLMDTTYRQTMDSIASINKLSQAIMDVTEKSKKVEKVIKVIDDIAFQTNILALNAAVEAARAGEVGRGFAVVADQVKNLAQKSAEAAKETAGLIESAIQSILSSSELSDEVKNGSMQTGELMEKVNALLEEINKASVEQLKGANQVTKAVTQINGVVQQNAASSEESASAGEELMGQSEMLGQIVVELSVLVSGEAADQSNGNGHSHTSGKTAVKTMVIDGNVHTSKTKTRSLQLAHAGADDDVEIIRPEERIPMNDFKDF